VCIVIGAKFIRQHASIEMTEQATPPPADLEAFDWQA